MSECVGWVGRFFGHKFRGRYSETREWPKAGLECKRIHDVTELMNHTRTYERDVCERCSEVVQPEPVAMWNGKT